MPKFKLVSSKLVLETPRFQVTHDRAVGPDDRILERSVVRHPGAVVILPMDQAGRVLLIRQFRLPPRRTLWELPAGTREPKETPLRTAKRELAEETGWRALAWRRLFDFYPSPGFCDERMTVFLATKLREGTASPEPDERIEPRWFRWSQAMEMVGSGIVRDGKTIAALLYADRFDRSRKV